MIDELKKYRDVIDAEDRDKLIAMLDDGSMRKEEADRHE